MSSLALEGGLQGTTMSFINRFELWMGDHWCRRGPYMSILSLRRGGYWGLMGPLYVTLFWDVGLRETTRVIKHQ